MTIKFATCSYKEFQPDMGIPVRASIGAPRFKLDYTPHVMPATHPTYPMLKMTYENYRRAYRAKLHRTTVDRVLFEGEKILRESGAVETTPLVLLCFEYLPTPGNWCHRTMFAQWWLEQIGDPVPELGTVPHDPAYHGAGADPADSAPESEADGQGTLL